MKKLSEIVSRAYSKIIKLTHIEVLSNEGWEEIDSLNVSNP